MRTYLPLNALRAFESAARHLSFTRAAAELCVTPTAISHQVRSLEDFLDLPLFERKNGKLTLTAAAIGALGDLSEGFNKLEAAISPLSRRGGNQKIVVAASPSVASLWLLPKLQRFVEAAPAIEVSIATLIAPGDFADAPFDVAISSQEDHPNRHVDFLMDESIVPVCAPSLVDGLGHDRCLALATLPLIHDDKACGRFPTWSRYLGDLGKTDRDQGGGLRFNQSSLAVEAGEKGYGLLLGRSRLIGRALLEGRLTTLDRPYSLRSNYYTVRRPGADASVVTQFLDWLSDEVAREDACPRLVATTSADTARQAPSSNGSARQRMRVGV